MNGQEHVLLEKGRAQLIFQLIKLGGFSQNTHLQPLQQRLVLKQKKRPLQVAIEDFWAAQLQQHLLMIIHRQQFQLLDQ